MATATGKSAVNALTLRSEAVAHLKKHKERYLNDWDGVAWRLVDIDSGTRLKVLRLKALIWIRVEGSLFTHRMDWRARSFSFGAEI